MTPLEIFLASFIIGKVTDEIAARYDGDKHPRLKKYSGILGNIAKLWLRLKGGE